MKTILIIIILLWLAGCASEPKTIGYFDADGTRHELQYEPAKPKEDASNEPGTARKVLKTSLEIISAMFGGLAQATQKPSEEISCESTQTAWGISTSCHR